MPPSTTTSRGRATRRLCAGSALACATLTTALTSALPAQDALRGWGNHSFATDATAVPAVDLAANNGGVAILRADSVVSMAGFAMPPAPPAPAPGLQHVQVAITSNPFGTVLESDGQLLAWGSVPANRLPPPLPANVTYTSISDSGAHLVARRSDGSAIGWGDNSYGQINLPTLPSGVTVVQAHAGLGTTLLLLTDGTIAAAGTGPLAPAPMPPSGQVFTHLWAGQRHAFARLSNGSLVGWGLNNHGQLNLLAAPTGLSYLQVACGTWHSAVLRSDGAVLTIGNNPTFITLPPTPVGRTIEQLVAGLDFTAARLDDGSVIASEWRWEIGSPTLPPGNHWRAAATAFQPLGLGDDGDVYDFSGEYGTMPPRPPGVAYTAIAAGNHHAVALRSDGQAIAWGDNTGGQCNLPPLPPGMIWTAVAAGSSWTRLLRSDGALVRVGNGTTPMVTMPPPGVSYLQLDGSDSYYVLLRSDGTIETDNSAAANQTPPLPNGLRYIDVACTGPSCIALRSDGQVLTWGGAATPTLPPAPPGVAYVDVDAAADTFAVLRSDGRIVAASYPASQGQPRVPLPRLGEGIVEVQAGYTGVVRIGPTRSYVGFASGCAGTLPASRIVPRDTPFVGGTFRATVFDVPQDLALIVYGQQVAPVPLAAIGMPGCELHVSLDASVFVAGQDQQVAFALAIPNTLALLGATFANQAFSLDQNANAAGIVASDASLGTVGRP